MSTPEGYELLSVEPSCDLIEYWDDDKYRLIAQTRVMYQNRKRKNTLGEFVFENEYHVLVNTNNPYNCIPFWVLQNLRNDPQKDPTYKGTLSDTDDIYDLIKHFNHIISEQAEDVITNIHRPVVYYSEDHRQDPNNLVFGPGAVWPVGPAEDERVEPLPAAGEPGTVEEHLAHVDKAMQDLTFLGEAGFGRLDSNASGIALRYGLTPLRLLMDLKLPHRIETLQSVCKFLLEVSEERLENTAFTGYIREQFGRFSLVEVAPEDIKGLYFVDIDFGNLLPRDDMAFEQNELYKFKSGGQSLATYLDRVGHDDPTAEMERIKKENQDELLNPEKALLIKQAQQMGTTPPTTTPQSKPPEPGGIGAPGTPGMMGVTGGQGLNPQQQQQPGGNPQQPFGPMMPQGDMFSRQQGFGAGAVTPYMPRGGK